MRVSSYVEYHFEHCPVVVRKADPETLLVAADWFDEHGEARRAEELREEYKDTYSREYHEAGRTKKRRVKIGSRGDQLACFPHAWRRRTKSYSGWDSVCKKCGKCGRGGKWRDSP